MRTARRSFTTIAVALLAIGIFGIGAYAAAGPVGTKYELRPEAGKEANRDIPSAKSKSTERDVRPAAERGSEERPNASG